MKSLIMRHKLYLIVCCLFMFTLFSCSSERETRQTESFNQNWSFNLGDTPEASEKDFKDADWRKLDLPHDWSIEGTFDEKHPATAGGGALPGGIGWYRKTFTLEESQKDKIHYIQFDGIYMNSEVWINGHYLGKRPFGYISFQYELTPYLHYGEEENVIAVRVDNSKQPNSRWYSGSGIYRNVRFVTTQPTHVSQWGTYITSTKQNNDSYLISIQTDITNKQADQVEGELVTTIYEGDRELKEVKLPMTVPAENRALFEQEIALASPRLWNLNDPFLYRAVTRIIVDGAVKDEYVTRFGVRDFEFDITDGFILNGKPVKIKGVCNHHDLGSLGAAVNRRALERQLEILRGMGVNAIRTAHNPPAPELLELCDEMGFIVMDEAFDIWSQKKSEYDYAIHWEEWHARDLTDFIKRDRNHPSVFVWSIGNEIIDQWDSTGAKIAVELAEIVRSLDATRPVTAAMNPPNEGNSIAMSGTLDLIGYNYYHQMYENHPEQFPDKPFIATETTSALATRGYYDKDSDTLKRWPIRWDILFEGGNPGNTVSAYDQVSTPWGSTHEETWRVIKKHDFLSGMFIWTGFDYLGEPTPYTWPSRSSYFGVVDLAGFPKDVYYMYKSEWTDDPVLHIFPHWTWEDRDSVDVWAYFNSDEVELFLNGKSLGSRQKKGEELHVMWRVGYEPGTLKAVSRTDGMEVVTREVKTAGAASKLHLKADRSQIAADGSDLSFITVQVHDDVGTVVPHADHLITFRIEGPGQIIAVDNGNPVSHEPFKATYRKAFKGLALVVIQSLAEPGEIRLTATADGLQAGELSISTVRSSKPAGTFARIFGIRE